MWFNWQLLTYRLLSVGEIRFWILIKGLLFNFSTFILLRPLKGDLPWMESISLCSNISVSREGLIKSSWLAKFPRVRNLLYDKSNIFRFMAGIRNLLGFKLRHASKWFLDKLSTSREVRFCKASSEISLSRFELRSNDIRL